MISTFWMENGINKSYFRQLFNILKILHIRNNNVWSVPCIIRPRPLSTVAFSKRGKLFFSGQNWVLAPRLFTRIQINIHKHMRWQCLNFLIWEFLKSRSGVELDEHLENLGHLSDNFLRDVEKPSESLRQKQKKKCCLVDLRKLRVNCPCLWGFMLPCYWNQLKPLKYYVQI